MIDAPASPPLFVETFARGRLLGADVVDDRFGPEANFDGELHCVVKAPNGATAEGPVHLARTDSPVVAYAKYAALLEDRLRIPRERVVELWIDPGTGERSRSSAGLDTWVAAWSGERCLDQDEWSVEARDWGGVNALSLSSSGPAIDHVMFWAEETPPLVVRWSSDKPFVLAYSATRSGTILRPVILGDDRLASAYWGFFRSNLVEAADIVGRRAYQSTTRRKNGVQSLVAAAHWACQFDAPDEFVRTLLKNLLERPDTDLDAAIMRWVLSFTSDVDADPDSLGNELGHVIRRLRTTEPLLTETFRLFVQKLGIALQYFEGANYLDQLREEVGWARRLASSTFWDTELTSYRAARPGAPIRPPRPQTSRLRQKKNLLALGRSHSRARHGYGWTTPGPELGEQIGTNRALAEDANQDPAKSNPSKAKRSAKSFTERLKIRFKSYDHRLMDDYVTQISKTAQRTGGIVSGPIPMPTKREVFTVNRSPHVDKKSREQFEIRTHSRVLYVADPPTRDHASARSLGSARRSRRERRHRKGPCV